MLNFALGLTCGIIGTVALIVIDTKLGRAKRLAKLEKERRDFMDSLTPDDFRELPPAPYEDFIVRPRGSHGPASGQQ